MKATNPTTKAQRRYYIEFTAWMVTYMVVLFGTRIYCRNITGPLETVIALSPMLPMVGVFVAVVRWIAGTDEFNRRIAVESLAIAGGATAMMAITYGFVEGDPLPHPSAFWVWTIFAVVWLLSTWVLRRRYR